MVDFDRTAEINVGDDCRYGLCDIGLFVKPNRPTRTKALKPASQPEAAVGSIRNQEDLVGGHNDCTATMVALQIEEASKSSLYQDTITVCKNG